jgi:uncharacterized membrane protein YedE/YeeE
MIESTLLASLNGGALIGLSAGLLLAFDGRIAGMSGIFGRLLENLVRRGPTQEIRWRAVFVIGLLLGGVLLRWLDRGALPGPTIVSPVVLVLAGLLVGFGARLGNGCTSGHGVCGIARLSACWRSSISPVIGSPTSRW